MKAISQIKFLATNYSSLQGLRSVPLGLLLLLICLWANNQHGPAKDFILPIVFFLGAVLLSITIDQYYKHTFGDIKRTLTTRRIELIEGVVGGTLALGVFWVNISFQLPFTPMGLVFAAAFLAADPKANFPFNKLSIIKLIFSICLVMLSISPLYSGVHWWSALGIKSALIGVTILFSMLIVAQGVIWHIFFVKSLPTREAKDE